MISIGHGDERREHMLNDPMKKLIPSVAVSSIISMLVGAFYNMADTFFVGRLGNSVTGAVGVALPVITILQALSFIFAHGASSYISRLLGSDEQERASRTLSTALFSALLLGLVYAAAGFLFLNPILTFMGATPTILPYSAAYAKYLFIAAPFFAASFVFNNTLRAEGSTLFSMIGMASGAVLNIILDPICIFTLNMGVGGAGFATMLGQMFSFFLLLSFYMGKGKKRSVLTLSPRLITLEASMYWELVRIGIPSFLRMGLNALAVILLNNAAGNYGDEAIAAFSIVARLLMVPTNALVGYGQGYQPISGFNHGARQHRRVYEAFRFTLLSSLLGITCICVLFIIFAPVLIALFRNDSTVISIGALALRMQSLTLPLMTVNLVSSMLFQSTGKASSSFITTMARQGLCFIPLLLFLPRLWGLSGLVFAQPFADVLSALITLPLLVHSIKNIKSKY